MSLPTWTITMPPDSNGEAAVPQKSLHVSTDSEKSLLQSRSPLLVLHAVRLPLPPRVKRRSSTTSGVEYGPLAMRGAYWLFSKVDRYFSSHCPPPPAMS